MYHWEYRLLGRYLDVHVSSYQTQLRAKLVEYTSVTRVMGASYSSYECDLLTEDTSDGEGIPGFGWPRQSRVISPRPGRKQCKWDSQDAQLHGFTKVPIRVCVDAGVSVGRWESRLLKIIVGISCRT